MRVLVVGATGVVGRQLVPLLVADGHTVVGTATSEAGAAAIIGAEALVLDVLDASATEAVVASARPDVVVCQATALSSFGGNMRKFERYFAKTNRLRTEGTANLLAAVERNGGARVIAQSYAASAYPPGGSYAKDEDEGFDPDPPKAMADTFASMRRLEESVATASQDNVCLRYGFFYGPGTTLDVGGVQLEAVRKRQMPVVGDGDGAPSYLHVEDAAGAVMAVLENGHGVYNIVDDEPAPFREWLPFVAGVLGAKPPRHVPVWLGRLFAGDAGVYMMTRARGGSNAKARRELGWEPVHPDWRTGFRTALSG
ncbi:NAD-dependent epimerase/dehydratase family protein [Spirillospora sp. CA-142024]|uniref:NAD-dependent epimerase/dehydratase family protein n=1 Tax=Spirillospora sp. CA-142024 TaxID=3240036 RepID=UPI003D8D3425